MKIGNFRFTEVKEFVLELLKSDPDREFSLMEIVLTGYHFSSKEDASEIVNWSAELDELMKMLWLDYNDIAALGVNVVERYGTAISGLVEEGKIEICRINGFDYYKIKNKKEDIMKEIKIKGTVFAYVDGKMQEIEITGTPKLKWNKYLQIYNCYLEAECPFDKEKLTFDIIFKGERTRIETDIPGDCEHFSPPKNASLQSWEREMIEQGIFRSDLSKKKFAELMNVEVEWKGSIGDMYRVFVNKEKKENF